jgi:hypothetical protein
MVLVPPDAAIRMRMQTEANLLQPVQPARATPSELPELVPGQQFTARIQAALPDNTYRALVAGRQLTLQLPEGAKAGDELELVVIDRSAKVVIARQAEGGGAQAQASPYPYLRFSPAARLIGQLLPAEGEAAPPTLLNRGAPLLAQPPLAQGAAAALAQTLANAVAQSGLFYESHQAQWVGGRLPLAALLREPQGQLSAPAAFRQAAAEKVGAGGTAAAAQEPGPAGARAAQAGAAAADEAAALVRQVPDELRPLVQQQLDAAATQRMAWHGEVWPRQALDWEIEWHGGRAGADEADAEGAWRTALALETPRLGRVEAELRLSAVGVAILLNASSRRSLDDLRSAAPELATALAGAGVPLRTLRIALENEHPAGQG